MIPAYQFNIDEGVPEVHDDPQQADLASGVPKVATIEAEIRSMSSRSSWRLAP
jgi:hypothetical protein